jgi:hypothetical protein
MQIIMGGEMHPTEGAMEVMRMHERMKGSILRRMSVRTPPTHRTYTRMKTEGTWLWMDFGSMVDDAYSMLESLTRNVNHPQPRP